METKDMDRNNVNLAFVNYLSRSGSTFLCRLLDEYEEVSVGIEAGFPGAIHRLIPVDYEEISDDHTLKRYLDELFGDIRFQEWKIDREVLFRKLKSGGYPLTFKDILLNCMIEYFGDATAKVFVHKAGYYIDILEDVQKTFGDTKNIFVIRDPRAIYNSQKNASCLYTGKAMGHSLPYFVWQYRKRARIVEKNKGAKNLFCIRYENLIENTQDVVAATLRFLEVRGGKKKKAGGYGDKIPANQQKLHTNVTSAPNRKSLEKWKTGLRKDEILFIQNRLSREMSAMNYVPVSLSGLSGKEWLAYIRTELTYRILQVKMLR
ncbi:MAG: sulfotransferase [Thermodesulfobacteriota bacterium]